MNTYKRHQFPPDIISYADGLYHRFNLSHKVVTDELRSYPVTHRAVTPDAIPVTNQYANHRAEQSLEATRVRERGMLRYRIFSIQWTTWSSR